MALPIKTTPTLREKEARDFVKKDKANEKKCAPRKEVLRAIKSFMKFGR